MTPTIDLDITLVKLNYFNLVFLIVLKKTKTPVKVNRIGNVNEIEKNTFILCLDEAYY